MVVNNYAGYSLGSLTNNLKGPGLDFALQGALLSSVRSLLLIWPEIGCNGLANWLG